ncbi:uncharacterized protein [Zea mays]|uniref:uncharacterized protein n=1 Tax=Zea mays TaxID=4577 RepID=UPI0004DEA54E|nr:uncharacterized protein LOC103645802 [Zea mays]XP_008668744.1 uncharacterized protein LOC103645802 [Zea mays]|eukprot:XP_008668743.1 uncharacterized protein LOC103645802 [Zea mays]
MSHRPSLLQRILDESSSDDDDDISFGEYNIFHHPSHIHRKRVGSMPGHIVKYRDRQGGHARMFQDYLADNSTFSLSDFRRRYRMSRDLFKRIMAAVQDHDDYFQLKFNAANIAGLSCFQKVTAVFRMLTYGVAADATDEYVRIGESTVIESLRRFVKAVIQVFGDEYLRSPNENDTARLLELGKQRGFPGMLGSIDCMHWRWKNCPSAWHAEGQAPQVHYSINGHNYTMGYYLADGIYPSWATLVKTIPEPQGNKRRYFAKAQEALRKDVERAFGVLQSRFAIVRGPARFWDEETLGDIMKACVIMHNMIVEDEEEIDPDERFQDGGQNVQPSHDHHQDLDEFIEVHRKIRDKETHHQLQEDLVEHIWRHHADEY